MNWYISWGEDDDMIHAQSVALETMDQPLTIAGRSFRSRNRERDRVAFERFKDHQSLGGQSCQCFAQRCLTDFKFERECVNVQSGARRNPSIHDAFFERLIDGC